ncbi:hypothetical protein [Natronorubrum sp. A-ect3]|uniref:hypothetical protein n=1 Tax=Natronorubrum sp. A-ect3 TaxID=3242698 RepID=UPI00359E7D05
MEDHTVSRTVPGSVGLLGALVVAGLAVLGGWGFVDGVVLESTSAYLAPTVAVLAVTVVVVGALIALGARSKQWREGPYW